MRFRTKPFEVEAITFDEMVEHGRQNGANIVNGMPWSFHFQGFPVTHEADDCYLISTPDNGSWRLTPSDMLVVIGDELYVCSRSDVETNFVAASGTKRVILESPLGNVLRESGEWERVKPGSPEYESNVAFAKACMADSLRRGEAPFASHLLYAQPGIFDDANEEQRKVGMEAGFAWNRVADGIVVYCDRGISPGMVAGLRAHLAAGVPVEFRSLHGDSPSYVGDQLRSVMEELGTFQ